MPAGQRLVPDWVVEKMLAAGVLLYAGVGLAGGLVALHPHVFATLVNVALIAACYVFLGGSLAADDPPFRETDTYEPNSPYSASKAASDHLVRAWHHTYGLPVVTTNCSNNYGPFHFPEKLIPLMLVNALGGKPLPVYGDGQNVRDWLYVEDHCDAIWTVLNKGRPGEVYNVGGNNEMTNRAVTETIILKYANGSFHYIPDVTGDQPPVDFTITASDDHSFVAENPQHDFPKLIRYRMVRRKSGDILEAQIEGNGKVTAYTFEKIE